MAKRKREDFLKDLNPFSFGLPRPIALILVLLIMSLIMGIGATALLNYKSINTSIYYIAANGSITGLLVIMLPALLTIIIIKLFRRYIDLKYIVFVAIIGTFSYSVFILLSSIIYIGFGSYTFAGIIIIVGDASLFGWWFFASKVLMMKKRRNIIFALIQPTLNILLYLPYSSKIISFTTPFNLLLIKLYAGIFIFMVVSYTIIYMVDRPYKRKFNFYSFDAFTQLLQNWLFDINTSAPFGAKFGVSSEILTDTLTMRDRLGNIKAVFFAPDIHYGPAGTLGGSNFPYMLERHVTQKYKIPAFIMHRTVDMDNNPVSSAQYGSLREALENGIKHGTLSKGVCTYTEKKSGYSKVSRLGFGDVSLVTLTRSPRITEDVSHGVAVLFREMLELKYGRSIVIDAHNSRFETAPKEELDGVKEDSNAANEYFTAIKEMDGPDHKSKAIRAGFANTELYHALGDPEDIARGNLNLAVFGFNGFKFAIVHINANNMLPQLRKKLIEHIKQMHGLHAEIYTTDTHAVNSLGYEADNVVGRTTKFEKLSRIIDKTIPIAMNQMETIRIYHNRSNVKRFKIWGQSSMSQILTLASSTYKVTRVMIPAVIVLGFIIAAWVVYVI